MMGSFVRKHLKSHSICQSQLSLQQCPGGRLVQSNPHVFTVKALCRQRMCDFYRHADRKNRESGIKTEATTES